MAIARIGKAWSVRILFSAVYGLITFSYLTWICSGDLFCSEVGQRGVPLTTAKLALFITLWDAAVSVMVASLQASLTDRISGGNALAMSSVAAITVLLPLILIPFWIYAGFGGFRFENSWFDVHCLFVEGFGLSFLFVVAPVLGCLTGVREFVWHRIAAGARQTTNTL